MNKVIVHLHYVFVIMFCLVGLGGIAITGKDYISLLEQHKPELQWEVGSAEHFFIYPDNNVRHAVL